MEPRGQDQKRTAQTRTEEKPRRFRIVKLEERIAPGGKGGGNGNHLQGTGWTVCLCAVSIE